MQDQADRASRYITCADKANEHTRQKLNKAKKVLGNIIALLDDVQEKLNISQKDVEL